MSEDRHRERIEALFEEFLEEGSEDFERWVRAHPDAADDLRELWCAWAEVERIGRSGDPAPRLTGPARARYELDGVVARGGMGVVYRVRDRELERQLAMKISREPAGDLAGRRFEREARVTAQLDHPGVLPLHDVGRDETGRPYFTMKLVDGRTLLEVLELVRAGASGWTPSLALGALVRVCDTLAFAHSLGVVHRDVKPQNVMVGRFGEVYVMDWGVAKLTGEDDPQGPPAGRRSGDDGTLERDVLGTPAYMAPEQAEDPRSVDPRVDVYAVGAILYHLLTGHAPYRDEHEPEAVLDALREGPPTPIAERGEAPAELEALCEKAMARAPGARYASMGELRTDLTNYREQRVVLAHRRGPVIELRKWIARNRALALSTSLALLALLALLAITVMLQARSNRRLDRALGDAERHAYVANVAAAQQMLLTGDVAAARARLEGCAEALRGWEWDHLRARLDASVDFVDLRPAKVADASWDPERGWLAWGAFGGQLGVIDVATRRPLLERDGHDGWVNDVELDPVRAGTLVTAGDDGWLRIWDAVAGALEHEERPQGGMPSALAFAEDGRLAVGTEDGVMELRALYPYATRAAWRAHRGRIWSIAWDPAGRRLATSGDDNGVAVWDAATGEELVRFQVFDAEDTWHHWSEVHWNRSGEWLCGGFPDGSWHVWDVVRGETLARGVDESTLFTAVFAENEDVLLTGSTDSLVSWSWRSGKLIERIPGPERKVAHLERRGDDLLAVDLDRGVLFFSGELGTSRSLTGHRHDVCAVDVEPDRGWIASSSRDGTARVWDARSQLLLELEPSTRDSVAWGRVDSRLYTGTPDGELVAWSVPEGTRAATWPVLTTPVREVEVSPDGSWISAGDASGALALIDSGTGAVVHRLDVSRRWFKPAFHPTRPVLAVATGAERIALIDLETGAELSSLASEPGPIRSLAFDSTGSRLLSCGGATIVLWDLERQTSRSLEGHSDWVTDAIFFDGDRRIASSSTDLSIKVWDPATGESLMTLSGHFGWVLDLAEDPTGRGFASCSSDRTVRSWTARNPWR